MFRSVANVCFCVALMSCCAGAALMGRLIHLLPGSKKQKEENSLWVLKYWWGLTFLLSPWIKIIKDPVMDANWETLRTLVAQADKDVASGKQKKHQPVMVFGNHTTFLDVPLSVILIPNWLYLRARTYMGAFLYNLPIIGTICHVVGHFPVYFKSTELNSFKVDAEKMEKVEANVDAHMADGGFMVFYPEGQVNKKEPDQVMDFRYGGMKRALDCNARIGMLVFHGNSKVWPARAKAAGFPGTIRVTVEIIAPEGCQAYVKKLRDAGLPAEEKELTDQALMANYMKKDMQKIYDKLKAQATGSKKQD